jgi:Protein of unknown function (DUF1569)
MNFFDQSTYEGLLQRLSGIENNSNRKWGRMSPAQTLEHLDRAIGSGVGRYQFDDISNVVTRTLVKWIVIYLLPRFPHNTRTGPMLKVRHEPDFDSSKLLLLETLHLAFNTRQTSYFHPLFGEMSKSHWGILVYKHLDHHLRQFGL